MTTIIPYRCHGCTYNTVVGVDGVRPKAVKVGFGFFRFYEF